MDISKEYIEMCRKAEEVQEGWITSRGDFIVWSPSSPIETWCNKCTVSGKGGYTWLPRQDQLQEMVKRPSLGESLESFVKTMFPDFHKTGCTTTGYLYAGWFDSLEQLWFAFVMHERYNKKWNGGDWVKAKG